MFGKDKQIVVQPEVPAPPPVARREPETTPATWLDMDPAQLKAGLEVRTENRNALLAWVRSSLVEGTDYGRIHFVKKDKCPDLRAGRECTNEYHYSKPSLWKAGAEKITGMLGLRVEWPNLLDEMVTLKNGAQIVTLRCVLLNQAGEVVSEGVGARSLSQDYNDPNKSLKMAKKSSHIDAVLSAAGLSEVFTQDLAPEPQQNDENSALSQEDIFYLEGVASDLFGDEAISILESLARRRFHFEDSDYRRIPAHRLNDAVASLKEKREDMDKPQRPVPPENDRFRPR